MIDIQKQTLKNANTLQGVIGDNLFPELQHISDVKQVLELMKGMAQNISQEQLRAIIMLKQLGENKVIHPDGNPYEPLVKAILNDYKTAIANPSFYLDTIEELIPKPPKPVIFAPNGKQVSTGR